MDEIVWAVQIRKMIRWMNWQPISASFAQELLTGVGVRCRLEMPAQFPRWNLSAEVRHNVFLAFKEAVNNALKHGQPSEVRISLVMEEARFVLSVEDDGRGFARPVGARHWPRQHAQPVEAGGQASIESQPGKGTMVRLVVPLEATR